ncbi:hypothetical protein GALL_461060 [mine drainage metagenome]|uniref:Uncharacterized protein n=1 Tax=mine drainage metagenome TaxID=410659 RepID=A0A1J5PL57_9ZZZZ
MGTTGEGPIFRTVGARSGEVAAVDLDGLDATRGVWATQRRHEPLECESIPACDHLDAAVPQVRRRPREPEPLELFARPPPEPDTLHVAPHACDALPGHRTTSRSADRSRPHEIHLQTRGRRAPGCPPSRNGTHPATRGDGPSPATGSARLHEARTRERTREPERMRIPTTRGTVERSRRRSGARSP